LQTKEKKHFLKKRKERKGEKKKERLNLILSGLEHVVGEKGGGND